jgi:hypothetical protein
MHNSFKDGDIGRSNMRAHETLLPVTGTVPKRTEFDPNSPHVKTCNESNSNKLLKMEAKSTADRQVH